jgi:hypothetical protein
MDMETLARAFNEWMRRYTEQPERFCSEFSAVKEYLTQQAAGEEPSYGAEAAAYVEQIAHELQG